MLPTLAGSSTHGQLLQTGSEVMTAKLNVAESDKCEKKLRSDKEKFMEVQECIHTQVL